MQTSVSLSQSTKTEGSQKFCIVSWGRCVAKCDPKREENMGSSKRSYFEVEQTLQYMSPTRDPQRTLKEHKNIYNTENLHTSKEHIDHSGRHFKSYEVHKQGKRLQTVDRTPQTTLHCITAKKTSLLYQPRLGVVVKIWPYDSKVMGSNPARVSFG